MNPVRRIATVPKPTTSFTAEDIEAIRRVVTDVVRTEEIFREPAPMFASPHDIRSERAIIVAMRDCWARPEDIAGVRAEYFSNPLLGHCFTAILEGARRDETLAAALVLARIGPAWRVKLELEELDDHHQWGPVREHADRVIALARRRALIHAAGRLAAAAHGGDVSTDDAIRMIRETE